VPYSIRKHEAVRKVSWVQPAAGIGAELFLPRGGGCGGQNIQRYSSGWIGCVCKTHLVIQEGVQNILFFYSEPVADLKWKKKEIERALSFVPMSNARYRTRTKGIKNRTRAEQMLNDQT
jgi:hypothetical protein